MTLVRSGKDELVVVEAFKIGTVTVNPGDEISLTPETEGADGKWRTATINQTVRANVRPKTVTGWGKKVRDKNAPFPVP